jgi:hypothetical protein
MDPHVSFPLAPMLSAVATLVVVIAGFFIRAWIVDVNARLKVLDDEMKKRAHVDHVGHLEDKVGNKADAARLNELEDKVSDIEKHMVRREDLQRLEDKIEIRHEKHDAKLDRIVTLLLGHMKRNHEIISD